MSINIKKLAELSFTKNDLDPKKVNLIKKYLKRKDSRNYIKELSRIINKKTLIVTSVLSLNEEDRKKISSLFPGKKITYNIDRSLMMGVRIIEDDNIYELNLKNTLENIAAHIINTYD